MLHPSDMKSSNPLCHAFNSYSYTTELLAVAFVSLMHVRSNSCYAYVMWRAAPRERKYRVGEHGASERHLDPEVCDAKFAKLTAWLGVSDAQRSTHIYCPNGKKLSAKRGFQYVRIL